MIITDVIEIKSLMEHVTTVLDHGADFGYALYSNVECGKYILDKMKANVPKDNLQGIIDLLFGKYNSTTG